MGVLAWVGAEVLVGVRVGVEVLVGVRVFVAVGCLRMAVGVACGSLFVEVGAATIPLLGVAVGNRRIGWRVGEGFLTAVLVGDGLAGCAGLVDVGCGLGGTRVGVAARTILVGLGGWRIAVGGFAVGGLGVIVERGSGRMVGGLGVFVACGWAVPHSCPNVRTTGGLPLLHAHPSTSPLRTR